MWTAQLVLVCCLYFEKPYTLLEYKEARRAFQAVQQEGEGGEGDVELDGQSSGAGERHSSMTFSLRASSSPAERETDGMRTVPWTSSKNPEAEAGLLSRMTFFWMNPLFTFAHKHELEQEDIFDIRALFRSFENSRSFEEVWEEEKRHFKGAGPSLPHALAKRFFWVILPAAPLLMLQNVAQLTLPFLLGPLIEFMVSGNYAIHFNLIQLN
jgi:hypothetical protein